MDNKKCDPKAIMGVYRAAADQPRTSWQIQMLMNGQWLKGRFFADKQIAEKEAKKLRAIADHNFFNCEYRVVEIEQQNPILV